MRLLKLPAVLPAQKEKHSTNCCGNDNNSDNDACGDAGLVWAWIICRTG
jgi:hypothetical protein